MKKQAVFKTYSQIEELSGEFPAELSTRGGSFYIRMDPRFVRFWDLKPGDKLNVKINRVKRLVEEDEAEEND